MEKKTFYYRCSFTLPRETKPFCVRYLRCIVPSDKQSDAICLARAFVAGVQELIDCDCSITRTFGVPPTAAENSINNLVFTI